jgi:hypothetical protein
MEGLAILGILVGTVVVLAWMGRGKVGTGSSADIAAQDDIPGRPASGGAGFRIGGPGNDLVDPGARDGNTRARE